MISQFPPTLKLLQVQRAPRVITTDELSAYGCNKAKCIEMVDFLAW
jgi:hypothetical protein